MSHPVVRGARFFLAHAPGMVRHGSKPAHEIEKDPAVWESIRAHLRTFDEAVGDGLHQILLGNGAPESLTEIEQPRFENVAREAPRTGPTASSCRKRSSTAS